jgi:uncharacterized repeat protein (TIGR01451 family)
VRVLLGKPVQHRIVVRNQGTAQALGVRVELPLPEGVELLHTEPAAATVGGRVVWELGAVEAGSERLLQVDLKVPEPTTLQLRPTLHFLAAQTRVVLPDLTLTAEGPEKALRGERILFHLQAINNSKEPLYQVRLHYDVPDGLEHPGGKRIGVDLKDHPLQPGEKQTINLELMAVRAGKWINRIVAEADNGVQAEVQLAVQVTEPMLQLRQEGPARSTPGQEAIFRLEVNNPGPTPATQVRLLQIMPLGVEPLATSPPAHFDPKTRTLSWVRASLGTGEQMVVNVKTRPGGRGDWPLYALVSASNRGTSRVVHAMHVEEVPPLALEISARDTLDAGAEAIFEVHVINTSRTPCRNVRVTAQAGGALALLSSGGAAAVPVAGAQLLGVAPLVPPSSDVVYRARVRGQQTGPGWLHVELTSSALLQPMGQEVRLLVQTHSLRATQVGTAR